MDQDSASGGKSSWRDRLGIPKDEAEGNVAEAVRRPVPEATRTKIKDFFYNYAKTDAREKETGMKISKLSGFKPSTNDQLKPIRQLDLFGKRNKIEADTTLAEADKKDKLAQIDQQLAAVK